MDANYFQHITYMESYNEEKGTHLVNAGNIHYEPLGEYIPESRATLQPSLMALKLQFPTIQPMKPERFSFSRNRA